MPRDYKELPELNGFIVLSSPPIPSTSLIPSSMQITPGYDIIGMAAAAVPIEQQMMWAHNQARWERQQQPLVQQPMTHRHRGHRQRYNNTSYLASSPMPMHYNSPSVPHYNQYLTRLGVLVSHLPIEMLTEIFHHYLKSVLVTRRNAFARVCRKWHAVTLNSDIYRCMSIELPCSENSSLRLGALLSRASPRSPLDLDLTLTRRGTELMSLRTNLGAVLDHHQRFQRLNIELNGVMLTVLSDLRHNAHTLNMANLQEFCFSNENFDEPSKDWIPDMRGHFEDSLAILKTATNLRTFRVSMDSSLLCDLAGILAPMKNLTTLNIASERGSFSLSSLSIYNILLACPHMRTFTCSISPSRLTRVTPDYFLSQPKVQHTALRALELHCVGPETDMFNPAGILELFTIPRLRELGITWSEPPHTRWQGYSVAAIQRLIQRSRCSLRVLRLTGVDVRVNPAVLFHCLSKSTTELLLKTGSHRENTLIDKGMAGSIWKAYRLSVVSRFSNSHRQHFVRK